jgi:hypothetical protein
MFLDNEDPGFVWKAKYRYQFHWIVSFNGRVTLSA